MDKKEVIEINEIINCKNYLGIPVFNEIDKEILRELYLQEENNSFEHICNRYNLELQYLLELTRAYEYVKEELRMIKEENVRKK